jgi:hypothetical protein
LALDHEIVAAQDVERADITRIHQHLERMQRSREALTVSSAALKALAKRRSPPLCCTVKPDSSTASATLCSAASDTSPAVASPLAPG